MFFYCTTKVENYFKVGISRSLEGIKDRLSDYRSIQPGINILFFTEVSNGEELERSFKNKFYDYRIRKSECYRLRSDIIFRHVLKFIHREKISWHGNKKKIIKNKELFSFWHRGKYYVSSYYFEKQLRLLNYKSKDFFYEDTRERLESYDFTKKELRYDEVADFIPIATISVKTLKSDPSGKPTKIKNILNYCDFGSKKKFIKFSENYKNFLNQYYEAKYRSQQYVLLEKFEKENLDKRKFFKEDSSWSVFVEELTFDCIKKINPKLLKGYNIYSSKKYPDNFYSKAHSEIKYTQKITKTFGVNVMIKKSFKNYFEKIMFYPKTEFIEHLQEYMDLGDLPITYHGSFDDISEKKKNLIYRIRRIIKGHHRSTIEIIEKAFEENDNEK